MAWISRKRALRQPYNDFSLTVNLTAYNQNPWIISLQIDVFCFEKAKISKNYG